MPSTTAPSSSSTSGEPTDSPLPSRFLASRRRGLRRPMFGASLVLIGVVLIGIVLIVPAWNGLTGPTEEENTRIRPTQEVERIEVDIDAGAIEVVSGEDVLVDVSSSSGRGDRPAVTTSDLNDGVLAVTVSCSRLALLRACSAHVSLVVPPGTQVVATTGAGTITASDLSAGADLRASAGSIDVRDVQGDIRLRSDAGSIRGTVLRGTVDASTSTGSISLTVVEDVTNLSAVTEFGDVDLVVPEATYRVDAATPLGRTDTGVAVAADASRAIEVRSEVGDVAVRTATDRSTDG